MKIVILLAFGLVGTQPAPAQLAADPGVVQLAADPGVVQLAADSGVVAVGAYPDDPADSLYTAARAALAERNYARAAALFHDITSRYPSSTYAATAAYYEAFARYRLGDLDNLRRAYGILTSSSPQASGDAAALTTRVCGALVLKGDKSCQKELMRTAETGGGSGDEPNCPSEDNDMRISALDALIQLDDEKAMPILKEVLARRDTCTVELRRKALFLISQKAGSESADILLATARTDPDADVREQAVFWLSQVHDTRAVGMLDSLLVHSDDEGLREKALFALSEQHRSDLLRDFATRTTEPVDLREKALFWIGQSHDPTDRDWLRAQFTHEKDDDLREKILFDVAQQHDGNTGPWLLNVAADTSQSDEIRKKALFWGAQEHLISLQQLIALYDKTRDNQELSEGLIFDFAQTRDPAAVDELMSIAKNDKDPERRKRAIFWLGQSHDPRIVQFLSELINK
jgi:HEAT repeat protein